MKKFLAVFLTILLTFGVCSVGVSAKEADKLGIAVASDLHYNAPRKELEGDIDDPIFWYANRRAAMEDESSFIIDAFLNQCANDPDCEYVLLAGDLVDNGRSYREDHEAMAAKLHAFEQKTGKQVYVINGNHDTGDHSKTTIEDFTVIYKEFGYDEALATDPGTGSYTADLGDKYRLIALDTCDQNKSTEDGMNASRVEWVHQQTLVAKADGRYPIVMMHHNLIDHLPLQRILSRNFIIRFHFGTAGLFADWGVKMVISGHEHCNDAAIYTSVLGNNIYDFATTSLTMYPLQYRVFTLEDETIHYGIKTVDSIDYTALTRAVSGYTPAQLDLMKAGLNDYAKAFLKAGVQYRLSLSLSRNKTDTPEDAFYYDLVCRAVDGLLDLLDMPLYGENSMAALAATYGIEIPESNYKNGWDVATQLVAEHYAGEETSDLDSVEVGLLLRCVAVILRAELAGVKDYAFTSAANAILAINGNSKLAPYIQSLGESHFGSVSAGEYFVLAIIAPFLYEFGYDADGINDNTGTIEGYGAPSHPALNMQVNLSTIGKSISLYISFMLRYVVKALEVMMPAG